MVLLEIVAQAAVTDKLHHKQHRLLCQQQYHMTIIIIKLCLLNNHNISTDYSKLDGTWRSYLHLVYKTRWISACWCLLWLWPLTQKPNQYVSWPRYICDLILAKLAPIVTKILQWHGFLHYCLLGPWPLTPKSNQHIHPPKYICDQDLVKSPLLVFEIWCHKVFGLLPAVTLTYDPKS